MGAPSPEDVDWGRAWADAQSRSPMRRRERQVSGWPHFWDLYAGQYLKDVLSGEADNRELAGFLRSQGMLRDGDRVIDVGCGPGTYALLLAEHARSVTALDISAGMLGALAAEAERRGLSNVETVQGTLDGYCPPGRFDLAFSAFSTAVSDGPGLLRMEELSSRSCCLVTSGAPSGSGIFTDMFYAVYGGRPPERKKMALYPFHVLFDMGRRPGVRFFDVAMTVEARADDLARIGEAYMGIFADLDDAAREAIRGYVASICTDGIYRKSVANVVALIYWDAPRSPSP